MGFPISSLLDDKATRAAWERRRRDWWATLADEYGELPPCLACGNAEREIHAHHIDYSRAYGDEHDSDLVPLCDSCHGRVHGLEDGVNAEAESNHRPPPNRNTILPGLTAMVINERGGPAYHWPYPIGDEHHHAEPVETLDLAAGEVVAYDRPTQRRRPFPWAIVAAGIAAMLAIVFLPTALFPVLLAAAIAAALAWLAQQVGVLPV